ncbi:MAG: hypothetical protein QGD88_09925 [Anaerolineae bacterium]|nr:hypothetical protein [Anaerolineae bacterium]MDK1081781.1 hypothetical protein [Anaerolineae bacterium]
MSRSRGSFLDALLNFIAALFGRKKPIVSQPPQAPANDPNAPAQVVVSKVLLLVYDPIMNDATGQTLSDQQNWLNTDALVTNFVADILYNSHNMARYKIVERIDVNEFPAKVDGFRYTPLTYMDVLHKVASPYKPSEVDYYAIIKQFNLLERIAKAELDEVWIFSFPHAGIFESIIAGPGAYWCNAPPLKKTEEAQRRFVIMGYSFERGVGEMLESFGHRTESILEQTFKRIRGDANLWRRFIRNEKNAPGKAALGNIHFAPNSERDYDWSNPRTVRSECYDWLQNFPEFKGDIRNVNASEWGNGDIRTHHLWWLNHIPHVAGRRNGILNNWWQYIINPQNVRL